MNRWMASGLVALAIAVPHSAARAALISSTWVRGDGKTFVQFTSGSDAWTIPVGVNNLEVLVVGGGGAAYSTLSGGAGAGGLYSSSSYSVAGGSSVTVAVGLGASASASPIQAYGGNSIFGSIIAYGGMSMGQGGSDGYRPVDPAYTNTQGGNQGGYSLDGGSNIVPGNTGGIGAFNGNFYSGGGAGAPGAQGNGSNGGIGVALSITGTSTYYAGGGACFGGLGGQGGGGNGGTNGNYGSAGLDGFGGGAGGSFFSASPGNVSGGSGVVTVAYVAVPEPGSVAVALCGAAFGLAAIRRRKA